MLNHLRYETMGIEEQMVEVRQKLAMLPAAEEPPPTTLQVLGRNSLEQDWQRLLVYFLSPAAAHGLDHAVLEHVLLALSDRDDLDYTFSRFDLEDVQLEREVSTAAGIPDLVLWASDDWFICWELKVHASEGRDQTVGYVDVPSFEGIGLDKDDVLADGHHYVYLAPESASPPNANEFVHISWRWVASQLQSFLADSYAEYPARTTAQLKDFVDTIRSELTMTDYQANQQEKVELYVDYYDEIAEIEAAFDDEWTDFTRSWGTQLARTLDGADLVEDANVPGEYAAVDLTTDAGEQRRWTFRQGESDWSWLFPTEWWTKLDEGRPIADPEKPNGRVGFLHRLDWHRHDALRDHTLVFYVRNAPSGHDEFYHNFADRFDEASAAIAAAIEETNFTITGNRSNVLRAEYDITVDARTGFFDAYIDALARGLDEGIVANQDLIDTLDRIYEQTIDEDVQL